MAKSIVAGAGGAEFDPHPGTLDQIGHRQRIAEAPLDSIPDAARAGCGFRETRRPISAN